MFYSDTNKQVDTSIAYNYVRQMTLTSFATNILLITTMATLLKLALSNNL